MVIIFHVKHDQMFTMICSKIVYHSTTPYMLYTQLHHTCYTHNYTIQDVNISNFSVLCRSFKVNSCSYMLELLVEDSCDINRHLNNQDTCPWSP